MNIVKLQLRTEGTALDEQGNVIFDGPYKRIIAAGTDEVDLDRLSPRARALAEAIAASPLAAANEIWVECDRPIRETLPDWQMWYSPERADQPERRPWSAWDRYKAGDDIDPHAWLERQAAKIPPGWHVLGPDPHTRVATAETGMTAEQVLTYLRGQGRPISPSTWRSYVARGQAPAPARRVGRTPLWDPADIHSFERGDTARA